MPKNDKQGEEYRDGNIWGWKISLISLVIILITFIAIMLSGGLNTSKPSGGEGADSIGIEKGME